MKIITLLLLLFSLPVLADMPAGFNGDIAIVPPSLSQKILQDQQISSLATSADSLVSADVTKWQAVVDADKVKLAVLETTLYDSKVSTTATQADKDKALADYSAFLPIYYTDVWQLNQAIARATPIPVIDIMVVATTVKQTKDYVIQRLQYLETITNKAFVDSTIKAQIRIVHIEWTDYDETNANNLALADLVSDTGKFSNISTLRKQYGADLVYLFRPLYVKASGNCGLTFLEFANESAASQTIGFGTIGDGNAVDEAGYFCGVNTFSHELGHSLGLVHDRADAHGDGFSNYSYAWSDQGVFATIMSYQTPMLMYYSTPLLTNQCAGQPCGYPASDATRGSDQTSVVNVTATIVAQFMPTVVTNPVLQ